MPPDGGMVTGSSPATARRPTKKNLQMRGFLVR